MKNRLDQQSIYCEAPHRTVNVASMRLTGIVWILLFAALNLRSQQITLERFASVAGTVESVSAGAIVLVDERGARHELLIAEHDEETVPLKKA